MAMRHSSDPGKHGRAQPLIPKLMHRIEVREESDPDPSSNDRHALE